MVERLQDDECALDSWIVFCDLVLDIFGVVACLSFYTNREPRGHEAAGYFGEANQNGSGLEPCERRKETSTLRNDYLHDVRVVKLFLTVRLPSPNTLLQFAKA